MKLLILGAGNVGNHLARTAATIAPFSHIVIADLNAGRAAAVAKAVGGSFIELDATDHDAVVSAMRSSDMTVSAIGPATRFGVSTLRAAIEARTRYAEISDDPHPTLDMLELDAAARKAGVTAIVGLGASPGIANMLAVEAGSRLDRVDRIMTGWGSGGSDDEEDEASDGEASAALEHWVEQASGTIPILRDGRIVEVAPLSEVEIDYPGIGRVKTRTIGHPEPITLKRRFPELRDAMNVMDFPSYIFSCLEKAARHVDEGGSAREGASLLKTMLSDEPAGTFFSEKAVSYALHEAQDAIFGKRWLPPLWALAEGEAGGHRTRVAASLAGTIPGGTGRLTGVPAIVAAAMLADDDILCAPGVHSIETAVSSTRFFNRLSGFLTDADGKVPVTPVVISQAV